MKKKVLFVSLLIILIVTLIFIIGVNSIAEEQKEIKSATTIYLAGGRVGEPGYIFSQALAYFINKKSDWLRADVVATAGATANVELVIKNPTEYFALAPLSAYGYMPKEAQYGNYDKLKFIANGTSNTFTFVTYDPTIKSFADLSNKTVNISREGAGITHYIERMIQESGAKNIKLVYGGTGEAVTNLKDGLVDVSYTKIDRVYPATWLKSTGIIDMETRKPLYYVNIQPQVADRLIEQEGSVEMPCRVYPGAIDPRQQAEVWALSSPLIFAADERMDEKIVYEITRVIFETPSTTWAVWHSQGAHMNEDFIPVYFGDPSSIHPGALKYYNEHGVKLVDIRDVVR